MLRCAVLTDVIGTWKYIDILYVVVLVYVRCNFDVDVGQPCSNIRLTPI
jgi:hypothetical protein